jgi:hypothetical protein
MSLCKACHDNGLILGVTGEGWEVLLDPKTPVYAFVNLSNGVKLVRTTLSMAAHSATCPKAADLSKGEPTRIDSNAPHPRQDALRAV